MSMDYKARYGDWALVLGGSEGLGRAIAHDLAARGMNIALAARREGPLAEAATDIAARHGVATRTMSIDLADDDVITSIETGMADEDVSFLVYNAAAEPYGAFTDLPIEDLLHNIAVNITTPTRIAHHFGRAMIGRGRGGLVICSSLAGDVGLAEWVAYGAAKSYENILGQGLWYELGEHGVNACTLMVGMTWTDSFQRTQKRLGGIYAQGREPANLPPGFAIPQLPEDASATLFAQIDKEWLPMIYANAEDEARAPETAKIPKADLIRMAAQMQKDWYA